MKKLILFLLISLSATVGYAQGKQVMYQNGEVIDSIPKGVKETALEKVIFLNPDSELEESTTVDDLAEVVKKTSDIFLELFKDSQSPGEIMVEIKLLKKGKAEVNFAVRDDIDLAIMGEFEKRIKDVNYPKSKKYPVTIQLIYKVNSFSDEVASAPADETISIPPGVVYHYAAKTLVDSARQLITSNINNNTDYSLSGATLIIGPVLWKRFKDIQALQNIEGGNVDFHVDQDVLKGKMTQSVADSKTVWNEFRKEVQGQSFTIRKLNEAELKYYWSVISFDIDEPLLIVETKDHKYILNILNDSMKLMWLDEVPQ